jgi:hypothetical protein
MNSSVHSKEVDVILALVRRWAGFRGERCLNTVVGVSAPFKRGDELIVGNRCYVVTRTLRAASLRSGESQWEIWGLRQPGQRQGG